MKDCFDISQDVRSLIDVPEVLTLLGGGRIYEHSGPINSRQIDIVIGVLGVNNEYLQNANVNIRIHAPSIQIKFNGVLSSQPNIKKFKELCEVLIPLLNERYKASFSTSVANTGDVFHDTDGSWFCLIQVEYFSIQDNLS